MGGIGKTTIARLVFDIFSAQYEGCCFLRNIRDGLKNCELSYLQDELVSKLLGENSHINDASKENSSTMRRLSKKKVLVVLDDVNTPELLKDFLEPFCFEPRSRVIVTSRDKQVFTVGGFRVHKVNELNIEKSLELFCIHAFNERQPKMGYEELSKRAAAIAKGIPLALKVFGSHLHSKSKDIWESALQQFKKYPNQNIQRVLKLSYEEGLDDLAKRIFLDIAFFFKEEDKDYVIRLLDAWGFHGAYGIDALQDKALITISNDNRVQMHDLIQEMGWEIVRQESTNPGKRSRLRDAKEVYDVLKNDMGTNSMEGMLIDVSQIEVVLYVDRIKSMRNLRFLKFHSPLPIELPMWTRYFEPEGTKIVDCLEVLSTMMLAMPQQVVKLHQLPMAILPKLANSNGRDGVLVTNNVSGSKLQMQLLCLNIGYAIEKLMGAGAEVHIKSHHYLVMDGCSGSRDLSVLPTKIRSLNSTDLRMQILNSSTGPFNNLGFLDESVLFEALSQLGLENTRMELLKYFMENLSSPECCDLDIDGLQPTTLPEDLSLLRSMYYHRLSNRREQGTRKTKLLVLFDGFGYFERISFSSPDLRELSRESLYVLSSPGVLDFGVDLSCITCVYFIVFGKETVECLKHAALTAKFIYLVALMSAMLLTVLFRIIESFSPTLLYLHRNFILSLSPQFIHKFCTVNAKLSPICLFIVVPSIIWHPSFVDNFLFSSPFGWIMVLVFFIYAFFSSCLVPPLLLAKEHRCFWRTICKSYEILSQSNY